MPKFFIKSEDITNDILELKEDNANHIKNVLRLKIDDDISVCTENGQNYICSIKEINKNSVICQILKEELINTETKNYITLFQGLPKADKFEYIIQKCTELGVKEIVPVITNRCVVKLDSKSEKAKLDRWSKIAEAASKQSNRNIITKINNIIDINKIVDLIKEYDIILVPYENEKETTLKKVLKDIEKENVKIGIVIGPEGGFEEYEINILKQAGGKIVTLGNRILRTETAGIFVTSILLYEFNEI